MLRPPERPADRPLRDHQRPRAPRPLPEGRASASASGGRGAVPAQRPPAGSGHPAQQSGRAVRLPDRALQSVAGGGLRAAGVAAAGHHGALRGRMGLEHHVGHRLRQRGPE